MCRWSRAVKGLDWTMLILNALCWVLTYLDSLRKLHFVCFLSKSEFKEYRNALFHVAGQGRVAMHLPLLRSQGFVPWLTSSSSKPPYRFCTLVVLCCQSSFCFVVLQCPDVFIMTEQNKISPGSKGSQITWASRMQVSFRIRTLF